MLGYTWKRLRRVPLPSVAVLLFAAILSVVICSLEKTNKVEQKKYEETCRTIPVEVTITNLSGTKYTGLNMDRRFAEVFSPNGELGAYVSNLQKVSMRAIDGRYSGNLLYGITSLLLSPELFPENGTTITWLEGYGEEIFVSEQPLCLIPQGMLSYRDAETGETYVELYFKHDKDIGEINEYTCRLTVAGTYTGGSGKAVYAPYIICEEIYHELDDFMYIQAFQATIRNNETLEEFRKAAKDWFAEPNPLGQQTYWGKQGYTYYPFALDINEELLRRAALTLQNSITVNHICTVLVLCLSMAAGLLIGFLMVRNRKKEIALMRTMGTPDFSIYVCFVFEQLLCFVPGILLGGSYNLWQPADKLMILPMVFFAGLSMALLVFLRRKLITTIKEED